MPNFNFFNDGLEYAIQAETTLTDAYETYLINKDEMLKFIKKALTTPYADGYDVLLTIAAIPLYPVYNTLFNIMIACAAVYYLVHGLFTFNQQELVLSATHIAMALFRELLSFVLPTMSLISRTIATIGEGAGGQPKFLQEAMTFPYTESQCEEPDPGIAPKVSF